MDLEQLIAEYRSLELDQVIDHQKFREYALTYHSTAIEGSTLTEEDTRMLLDEGVTPKGKPLEHSLMVENHFDALQFTLIQAKAGKQITLATIQAFAGMVLKSTGKTYHTALGTIDASKGEFRKGNVRASDSCFVNYDKVEPLTRKLVTHLQQEMTKQKNSTDAIELAHAAHFDLVTIHPFYDGNGRTSRLLMNYVQAFYQLPLGNVFKEDRAEYFHALTETRKKEDLQIVQDFMKSQYSKLLRQEIETCKKIKDTQTLLPKNRTGKGKGHSLFL